MDIIKNNKELFEVLAGVENLSPFGNSPENFCSAKECAESFYSRSGGQFANVVNHFSFDSIEISGIRDTAFFYCSAVLLGVKETSSFHVEEVWLPECFTDPRPTKIQEDSSFFGEDGIKITCQSRFLGYYFPRINVLFATDWTHCERGVTLGIKILSRLIRKELCSEIFLSQKAKSLLFLREETSLSLPVFPIETKRHGEKNFFPAFLRTCPVNPRHGILESKIVFSSEELKTSIDKLKLQMELLNETEGEIVIQPFVEASSNFVWSEGMFVIAPDYDGVTAGKTPKITLSVRAPWFYKNALKELGLEEAEFEGVLALSKELSKEKIQRAYFTQVRKAEGHFSSGLKPKRKGVYEGFCSKITKANNFLIVRGLDGLLELEESRTPETVCLHIKGNLLSHASAWCRQNKTPYIILENEEDIPLFKGKWIYEIEKGWVLCQKTKPKSVKKSKVKRNEKFEGDFYKGIEDSLVTNLDCLKMKGWFTYLPFHHYATQVSVNPETAYLAGFFTGVLCRTIEAISVGEFRHSKVRSNWRKEDKYSRIYDLLFLYKEFDTEYFNTSRSLIYKEVFSIWTCSPSLLGDIKSYFLEGAWEDGYGGKKWATIIEFTILIRQLIKARKTKRLISATNRALNSIHNSGWAFDKIAKKNYLDVVYDYHLYEETVNNFLLIMEDNLSLLQGDFERVELSIKGETYEEDTSRKTPKEEGIPSPSSSFYKPVRL